MHTGTFVKWMTADANGHALRENGLIRPDAAPGELVRFHYSSARNQPFFVEGDRVEFEYGMDCGHAGVVRKI